MCGREKEKECVCERENEICRENGICREIERFLFLSLSFALSIFISRSQYLSIESERESLLILFLSFEMSRDLRHLSVALTHRDRCVVIDVHLTCKGLC